MCVCLYVQVGSEYMRVMCVCAYFISVNTLLLLVWCLCLCVCVCVFELCLCQRLKGRPMRRMDEESHSG